MPANDSETLQLLWSSWYSDPYFEYMSGMQLFRDGE